MTPSAVAPMKPPSTATWPAARIGAMRSLVRWHVAAMSGAAAMCSLSVTSTVRASTHTAGMPCAANAAATMRLLASSPIATSASWARGGASPVAASSPYVVGQPGEFFLQGLRQSNQGIVPDEPTRNPEVPVQQFTEELGGPFRVALAGQPSGLDQPVGDLRHRRHDHHRRLVPGTALRAAAGRCRAHGSSLPRRRPTCRRTS